MGQIDWYLKSVIETNSGVLGIAADLDNEGRKGKFVAVLIVYPFWPG